MRFSLSFVVAAMAAAVMASADSTHNKVPRDLPTTRMVRRSPTPSEMEVKKLKSQVDAKCYTGCDYLPPMNTIYQGGFSSYSQFTHVETFNQFGCYPNLLEHGSAFTQVSTGQDVACAFGVIATTLIAYGQYIQQQTLAIQSAVLSFHNLCSTLSGFIVQVTSISVDPGNVIVFFSQLVLAIQAFLIKCFTQFSQEVFIQAVGGDWAAFTSLFLQIIQYGHTCGFLNDPAIFVQQGINFSFFQTCGIEVSRFCDVSAFQIRETSCASFCSGSTSFGTLLVRPQSQFPCDVCAQGFGNFGGYPQLRYPHGGHHRHSDAASAKPLGGGHHRHSDAASAKALGGGFLGGAGLGGIIGGL